MAVKILKGIYINSVFLTSGRFYLFNYTHFQNDPEPLILLANIHWGKHEKTGHMHQYIQGVNFHYLSPLHRLLVYKKWIHINKNEAFSNKNFLTFWTALNRNIPNMQFSLRRYLINPPGSIINIKSVKSDFLLDYFENPVKLVTSSKDIVEKVILSKKMRAMGYFKSSKYKHK